VKHTPPFIELMRTQLLNRKAELTARLIEESKPGEITQGKDVGDEALSITMETLQSSLAETEIFELEQITAALSRIKKDEYGLCVECGDTISEKRLQYSPYAARCIVCQEEYEHNSQLV
jgi:RNA polymerase-binding transcription factor DksA